jgi:hypothetical protein
MGRIGVPRVQQTRALLCLLVKLSLSLLVVTYAADITSTTKTYYAENGGVISVTNNVTATDKGIARITSVGGIVSGTCGLNVTFGGTPRLANTTLTANDFAYTVEVTTTNSTPANTCLSVTLKITPASGAPLNETVYLATGQSVTENETVDCQFDIGPSLPVSPYSFIITVQHAV